MNINNNLLLLNEFFFNKDFKSVEKLKIIEIAKVSHNLEELKANLEWEYNTVNIKRL